MERTYGQGQLIKIKDSRKSTIYGQGGVPSITGGGACCRNWFFADGVGVDYWK